MLTLTVSCENLPNADLFTLTDALCVLFEHTRNRWVERGRTEVIHDCLNPKFIKNF